MTVTGGRGHAKGGQDWFQVTTVSGWRWLAFPRRALFAQVTYCVTVACFSGREVWVHWQSDPRGGQTRCDTFPRTWCSACVAAQHVTVLTGNMSWLRECLDNKVGINGLDKAGNTALYWASHGGHIGNRCRLALYVRRTAWWSLLHEFSLVLFTKEEVGLSRWSSPHVPLRWAADILTPSSSRCGCFRRGGTFAQPTWRGGQSAGKTWKVFLVYSIYLSSCCYFFCWTV